MRVEQPYGKRYKEDAYSEEPKKRYFIACEGRETEYQYFEGVSEFRSILSIQPLIEIVPIKHDSKTGSNPINIYEEARKAVKEYDNFFTGDELCIVVDRDRKSFKEEQYQKLCEANKQKEIRFCISNPCFEFWLLLHLCDCSEYDKSKLIANKRTGRRTQVEKYLKGKLLGTYNKTRIQFEKNFLNKIYSAIENAKLYETDIIKLKDNLGTNIGLLIEEMLYGAVPGPTISQLSGLKISS